MNQLNTEKRVTIGSLSIDPALEALVREEIMPGLGLDAEDFWNSFSQILNDLTPRNRELLEKRDRIQQQIDEWHLHRKGKPHDPQAYQEFLRSIDYLVPEGPDFKITTTGVDPEISQIPGPQLVVPVSNARYALNAANARWGSLLMRPTEQTSSLKLKVRREEFPTTPREVRRFLNSFMASWMPRPPWQKVRSVGLQDFPWIKAD